MIVYHMLYNGNCGFKLAVLTGGPALATYLPILFCSELLTEFL